ncbi:MAG TPA: FtsX-like permease family protein [Vicinamibacteria bacterium]|jgi:putative ABC transport system permease protein|nr:FtsX-like permease family protein [Vicinamibacteria bacterium]
MKFLPFVLKHLRRNWIRTLSTVIAMSVCIFLFCTLQTVLASINGMLESTSASRLVTRHAVSLVFNLPLSYEQRIAGVPGVKRVAVSSWFGGSLPAKKEGKADEGSDTTTDWSNFFPNMAVEAEPYFQMYPEFLIPPDQYQAFQQDLQGCVIGRKLATKFGWKIGDHFFLESFIPPYRKKSGPFEFVVRAIFDTDAAHPNTDSNLMLFHFKYLYEGTGQQLGAGTYSIEINDPNQAGAVSKAIDATFENSDNQTHTETEQAFAASFVAMAGNLAFLLNSIGLAVSFTILLVTANTMSMAVRERRTEIAVLKTLGFSSLQVLGLVVAEALALGALGGGLGLAGSQGLMWFLTHTPGIRDMLAGLGLSELHLKPMIAAVGFAVALGLGFAAGFGPALTAYRARITDMLRTV